MFEDGCTVLKRVNSQQIKKNLYIGWWQVVAGQSCSFEDCNLNWNLSQQILVLVCLFIIFQCLNLVYNGIFL
jgi:hypothetical protein